MCGNKEAVKRRKTPSFNGRTRKEKRGFGLSYVKKYPLPGIFSFPTQIIIRDVGKGLFKMSSGMGSILAFVQIFFIIVIGLYFWNLLRGQQGNKNTIERESRKEMEKLRKMRDISLTVPLAEKTRPAHFQEIIGQEEGLKALRAALCGPNPQHVIIYGPPGVGKTAAARLVLDEAKKCKDSPFAADAKFVEVDGATARFDERGIADPLIGSVHDPIYQGAGAMGMAGIPQPKSERSRKPMGNPFSDEIGELHSIRLINY